MHDDAAGRDALEEALGGQADRAADDVLHLPGRHQLEPLEPELADRHRADRVDHPAADAVARAVQELLDAAGAQVLEQGLTHPGQQQHLEVEESADPTRHLPQQVPCDHVGAGCHLADRHGHVTGRFAVAHDQHPFAARLLSSCSSVPASTPPPAAVNSASPDSAARRARRKSRWPPPACRARPCRRGGDGPAAVGRRNGRRHLGGQAQCVIEAEMGGVRREIRLYLRADGHSG